MSSRYLNVTDRRTDRRTDRQTKAISIPRYALVHRAVKITLLLASLFTLGSVVASVPQESLDNNVKSTEVADTTTWPFRILYVKASLWTLHLSCRDSNCNCCSNEVTLVLQLWPVLYNVVKCTVFEIQATEIRI